MKTVSAILSLPICLSLLTFTTAFPTSKLSQQPLPLLIWHGLGDRYNADGLQSVGELASSVNPGTYTYFIRISDEGDEDSKATFFGNVTEHLDKVCKDIEENKKLPFSHDGRKRVDALGFSQGGQFLRGLIETCPIVSVRSLVTFGSQHNGIADIKACGTWDFFCKGAVALMKGNAWSDYVQGHVVPAQYFRTVNETTGESSKEYLEHSNFLADVNNERKKKKEVYKQRLMELEKFVMFVFEEDTTVIPKESGWFAEVNTTSGEVTPLAQRSIYKDDWLGLKKLDEKGALVFKTTPGDHMQLDDDILVQTFKDYFGVDERTRFRGLGVEDGWFDFSHESMWPESAKVWDRVTEWAKPIREYL
ncbi:hypothetical protein AC579_9592 [Pseudocercospora musae]|uniref:Palmitoyl-protein thioesterase 1 n=1 Tax=Pseudocercospora musae TaxID=113226 RepID=A0A139IT94_9PEZI|nr:hypothetical protein AC579_9592 [Pseudocercospora musae]